MEQSCCRFRQSSLLNSIFISTLNTAAHTLISVASTTRFPTGHGHNSWKLMDHVRYFLMLLTGFSVWVVRVVLDHFPSFFLPSLRYLLPRGNNLPSLRSSDSSSSTSTELVVYDHGVSNKAMGRALSNIFLLLNEIPANSTKYQFAVSMVEKVVDENIRDGHESLQQINRSVLSAAFSRTASLLYRSLQQSSHAAEGTDAWLTRMLHVFPLGSYIVSCVKGFRFCYNTFSMALAQNDTSMTDKRFGVVMHGGGSDVGHECIVGEKHAHELLWITSKLRDCGAVDEAMVQWSMASALASFSLTANQRVQGSMVKISAILIGALVGEDVDITREVKFRLLVLWLPLFCYASNGLAYPVLTRNEKVEAEKAMEELISSLPTSDQEIILTNWLQDFVISGTDWPNLHKSYDRWCRSCRKVLI